MIPLNRADIGEEEIAAVVGRAGLIHKLEENNWNVTQTAQSIDTPRSNLYKKLEQYDIRREEAPREQP